MCRPGRGEPPAVRRAEPALGSFSGGQAQSHPHQATVRASAGPFPAAAMTYRALRPSKPAAVAALSPAGFLSFPGRLPLCGPVAADVVDVKLLGIPVRRWCRLLVVWELIDAEHDLHGIAGGLPDGLDQPVVDEEGHMLGRPLGRVDVELAGVYVEDFHGELVADGRVKKIGRASC